MKAVILLLTLVCCQESRFPIYVKKEYQPYVPPDLKIYCVQTPNSIIGSPAQPKEAASKKVTVQIVRPLPPPHPTIVNQSNVTKLPTIHTPTTAHVGGITLNATFKTTK